MIKSFRELQEEGAPDLIAELFELYLYETTARLAALRQAIANKDAEAIRKETHSLKGSSGYLGARGMTSLCEELERAIDKDDALREASALVRQMEDEFARIRETLELHMETAT